MIVAVLIQGKYAGMILVGLKQSGSNPHIHVCLHLQIFSVIGFVEVLFNLFIDSGDHGQLMILPDQLLILMIK